MTSRPQAITILRQWLLDHPESSEEEIKHMALIIKQLQEKHDKLAN